MNVIAKCRSCGADIIWARTSSGRNIPVDADPTPDGNVELTGTTVVVHPGPVPDLELRMAHHATCPQAAEWRRR